MRTPESTRAFRGGLRRARCAAWRTAGAAALRAARVAPGAAAAAVLLTALGAPGARAEESATQPGVPEVQVQRTKEKEAKLETLRFLKENRQFFRAQLDLLRQTFGALHFGVGDGLDPRSLMLRELLAEGRAHGDSAAAAAAADRTRRLLESVAELAELEHEMERMEESLGTQRERLARLEEDYAGRQETALVVLLSGVPSRGAPEAIELREEGGDVYRVTLEADERAALAGGGLAELLHSFVEPRELRFTVALRGAGWPEGEEYALVVEPERDRLTFLELELRGVESGAGGSIASRAWVR